MEKYKSVFDIIGPGMVGPSSSHTAGAARIDKIARQIFGEQPDQVDIYLYDSFAKTYQGHGTDIALVGGILGMEPDDERLSSSLKLAYEAGVEVCFVPKKEKASHPNTVKLRLKKGEHLLELIGESIGGGMIQVTEVNGFKIRFEIGVPTFLIIHQDVQGVIHCVSEILNDNDMNIGTMTVSRIAKGEQAIMVIEVDDKRGNLILDKLRDIPNLHQVSFFY